MKKEILIVVGIVMLFIIMLPLLSMIGFFWNYTSLKICQMYGEKGVYVQNAFGEHRVECLPE